MDFFAYIVFMFTGMVVAAFFGWLLMRKLWGYDPGSAKKGLIEGIVAIIALTFGANR